MSLLEEIRALDVSITDARDSVLIADALNVGRVRLGLVERADLAIWAASTGMRGKIEAHAKNEASPLQSIALSLRDLLWGSAQGVDLSIEANMQAIGAWVAMGELNETDRDALIAFGTHDDPVSEFQVRQACWADNGDWLL